MAHDDEIAAAHAFIMTDEFLAYVRGPVFRERWLKLHQLLDGGELLTVEASAKVVNMPVPVYRVVFGWYLAALRDISETPSMVH